MQKYQSHKVVEAAKIAGVSVGSDHLVLVLDGSPTQTVSQSWGDKHAPGDGYASLIGGWFVRYPGDGYSSWSPAEAFENGYTAVDGSVRGLPVAGYKPTQSPEAVALVSGFKADEERILRKLDALKAHPAQQSGSETVDQRWLQMGRTAIEQGFMYVNRSVFKPGRVTLPEDEQAHLFEGLADDPAIVKQ